MRSILPLSAELHPYADLGILRCEQNTRLLCPCMPAWALRSGYHARP